MIEAADHPYTIGQRVTCKVEKLFPYGVFVGLPGGTRGYIRRRELSWAGDMEPRHLVHEGQPIEAIVLKLPSTDRMIELSLRATLPDPWESFVGTCRVGDVVAGTVKQLMPYGVYVEILPGVNGFVPLADLAAWEVDRAEDVLWAGDDIEAIVTRIDGKTRKIGLSIRLRLKQQLRVTARTRPHQHAGDDAANHGGALGQLDLEPETKDATPAPKRIVSSIASKHSGRILVVDDEISEHVVAWLYRHGYEADAARTPEEALEQLRRQVYTVCLVDIELPGMDGLTLIRQIRAEGATPHIAVMSVAEWLGECTNEIEELGVAEVFVKPLDIDEVERLLINIEQGKALPQWRATFVLHQPVELEPFQNFIAATHSGASLIERLRIGLAQLVETARAEVGIIFHMDPVSQAITIPVQVGTSRLAEDALYSLEGSPVKDVLHQRRPIFENRVSAQTHVQKRFRKLLDLLPFESCIGVPIEVQRETHHALFLFHGHQDAFSHYRLRDALAAATLFAALIERNAFSHHVQSLGKFLLSGQLAAGFGHEVANETSGLEIQLRNLQTDCKGLEGQIAGLADSTKFQEVQQAVDSLLAAAGNLRGTIDLFQHLVRAEDEGAMDVNDVLRTSATLLQPIARRNKVRLTIASHSQLPDAIGSGIRLQQAFLNIMLNAIQHMAAKSQQWETLEVTTSFAPEDRERPIKVRFLDHGPGIHKQLWERIFAMGFSSRSGGSGLGLFIARSLVGSLGGKITVERSVVPLGTTFLIELRAAPAQEGAR